MAAPTPLPSARSRAAHRRKQRTAYHEAGHAVACFVLDRTFGSVTVVPSGHYLGFVSEVDAVIAPQPGVVDIHDVIIDLAGNAAERRFAGRGSSWARADHNHALDRLRGVASDGHSYLHDDSPLVASILRGAEKATEQLVEDYWTAIVALAEALMQRDTMTYFEVAEIYREAAHANR